MKRSILGALAAGLWVGAGPADGQSIADRMEQAYRTAAAAPFDPQSYQKFAGQVPDPGKFLEEKVRSGGGADLVMQGRHHAAQGRHDQAVDCFRRAVAAGADARLGAVSIAAEHLREGKFTEAEATLRELLRAEPGAAPSLVQDIATALASCGFPDGALRLMDEIPQNQRDTRFRFVLALLLEEAGQDEQALDLYTRCAEETRAARVNEPPAETLRLHFYHLVFLHHPYASDTPGRPLEEARGILGNPGEIHRLSVARLSGIGLRRGGKLWEQARQQVPWLREGTLEEWREEVVLRSERFQNLAVPVPPPAAGDRAALKRHARSTGWKMLGNADALLLLKRLQDAALPEQWLVFKEAAKHSDDRFADALATLRSVPTRQPLDQTWRRVVYESIILRGGHLPEPGTRPSWVAGARRWLESPAGSSGEGAEPILRLTALVPLLGHAGDTEGVISALNRIGHLTFEAQVKKGGRFVAEVPAEMSGYPADSLHTGRLAWCGLFKDEKILNRLEFPELRAWIAFECTKSFDRYAYEIDRVKPGTPAERSLVIRHWERNWKSHPQRLAELTAWSRKLEQDRDAASKAWRYRAEVCAKSGDERARAEALDELRKVVDNPENHWVVSSCARTLNDKGLQAAAEAKRPPQPPENRTPRSLEAVILDTGRTRSQPWEKVGTLSKAGRRQDAVDLAARNLEGMLRSNWIRNGTEYGVPSGTEIKPIVAQAFTRLKPTDAHGLTYREGYLRLALLLGRRAEALAEAETLAAARPGEAWRSLLAAFLLPPEKRNDAITRLDKLASENSSSFFATMLADVFRTIDLSQARQAEDGWRLLDEWQSRPAAASLPQPAWRAVVLTHVGSVFGKSTLRLSGNFNDSERRRVQDIALRMLHPWMDDPQVAEGAFRLTYELTYGRSNDARHRTMARPDARRVVLSGANRGLEEKQNQLIRHVNLGAPSALEIVMAAEGNPFTREDLEILRTTDPRLAEWVSLGLDSKDASELVESVLMDAPKDRSDPPPAVAARLKISFRRMAELPGAAAALDSLVKDSRFSLQLESHYPVVPLAAAALEELTAAGREPLAAGIRRMLENAKDPKTSHESYIQLKVGGLVHLLCDATEDPVVIGEILRQISDTRACLGAGAMSYISSLWRDWEKQEARDLRKSLQAAGFKTVEDYCRIGSHHGGWSDANTLLRLDYGPAEVLRAKARKSGTEYVWELPRIIASARKQNGAGPDSGPEENTAVGLLLSALETKEGPGRADLAAKAVAAAPEEFARVPEEIRDPVMMVLFHSADEQTLANLPPMARMPVLRNRGAAREALAASAKGEFERIDAAPSRYNFHQTGGAVRSILRVLDESGPPDHYGALLLEWARRTKAVSEEILPAEERPLTTLFRSESTRADMLAAEPKWVDEVAALDPASTGTGPAGYWVRLGGAARRNPGQPEDLAAAFAGLSHASASTQVRYLLVHPHGMGQFMETAEARNALDALVRATRADSPLAAALRWQAQKLRKDRTVDPELLAAYGQALETAGAEPGDIARMVFLELSNVGVKTLVVERPDHLIRLVDHYESRLRPAPGFGTRYVLSHVLGALRTNPGNAEVEAEAVGMVGKILARGRFEAGVREELFRIALAMGRTDLMGRILRAAPERLDPNPDVLRKLVLEECWEIALAYTRAFARVCVPFQPADEAVDRALADATLRGAVSGADGLLLRTLLLGRPDDREAPSERETKEFARLKDELAHAEGDRETLRMIAAHLVSRKDSVTGPVPLLSAHEEGDWQKLPRLQDGAGMFNSVTHRLLMATTCNEIHRGRTDALRSFTRRLKEWMVEDPASARALLVRDVPELAITLVITSAGNPGGLPQNLEKAAGDLFDLAAGSADEPVYKLPSGLLGVISSGDADAGRNAAQVRETQGNPLLAAAEYLTRSDHGIPGACIPLLEASLRHPGMSALFETPPDQRRYLDIVFSYFGVRAGDLSALRLLANPLFRTRLAPEGLQAMIGHDGGRNPEVITAVENFLTEQGNRLTPAEQTEIRVMIAPPPPEGEGE